jgi:hypothetical protein
MAMKQKINPLTWNFDMVSDGDSWTIKQKFNPLTWNFDMVGEWEVKMKLNPLTSNFDMVAEWGWWGGWQPWANTIAYRPLTEDLDDVTWNYDLSAIWNYYSFTTNQQWKACCELNPQDSNDTYFSTWQNASSIFDFYNNDYTFVCSLCDASSTVSGARSWASIFSLWPQFKWPNIDTYESMGSSTWWREFAYSISHTGPDVMYDFTQSDFKTIISVWNHTTQTFSYYVDWVLNAEDENTWSFNGFSNFYLCVDQYDMSDAARRYHWKIRDIIIENKARTAQEISDYCSQN